MSLTEKDIDHVLKLSHLFVNDSDKKTYLYQLQDVLDAMSSLDGLPLDTVSSDDLYSAKEQTMREDDVIDYGDMFLEKNAPDWQEGCFSVPKILDGSQAS